MQKKLSPLWTLTLLVLLILPTTSLQAAEIKGVEFADQIMIEEIPLKIRGVALLKWAGFFNIYAGALYLPKGHDSGEWNDEIAKSLELSYLHGIKAADFGSASEKLLKKNLTKTEYASLSERLKAFYMLFRDVKPGDRYRLTYLPGRGTELHWNGELLGSASGADFARAYFGIWLGDKPINKSFRDRLFAGDT